MTRIIHEAFCCAAQYRASTGRAACGERHWFERAARSAQGVHWTSLASTESLFLVGCSSRPAKYVQYVSAVVAALAQFGCGLALLATKFHELCGLRRFFAVSLCAFACAPQRVDFAAPDRAAETESYRAVLARWTRETKLYVGFDAQLSVRATLKTWDFQQSMVRHYADRYRLTATERDALYKKERARTRDYFDFVVVVHTLELRRNDLDSKTSPWRVRLKVNDVEPPIEPTRLVSAGKDPVVERFFPYHSAFSRTYVVSFPRPKDAIHSVAFTVAGPEGHATLAWSSRQE